MGGREQKRTIGQTVKDVRPPSFSRSVATAKTIVGDSLDSSGVSSAVSPQSDFPAAARGFERVYELGETLGEGGMGVVHRALDRTLHRTVAVKIMHDEHARRESAVLRFYKEAQISAQLEHPGIVPTYSIELGERGQPRLAMRLIRGGTLEDLILRARDQGAQAEVPLLDRLELFLRVCDAVHFAHERGVIHRDLKPENIMIGAHRDAYVMDWGLATVRDTVDESWSSEEEVGSAAVSEEQQSVDVDEELKATRMGELMGTVAYMAPEQAKGEQVGPEADQFSLGMILFELIALDPARSASNFTAGVTKAVIGERASLPPWVAPGLAAIVSVATHPEKEHRYGSVAALADDVRRYVRDEELSVLPDPFVKRLWKTLSRHQTVVLGGLLALVLLVGSLVVFQVVREAKQQQQQVRRDRHIAEQVAIVTGRAQTINATARGVEIELARLAGSVQQALSRPEPKPEAVLFPRDLRSERAPADTRYVRRYGQRISFERAVFTTVPGGDPKQSALDVRRLSSLQGQFRRAILAGGDPRNLHNEQESLPLQWSYAATPSGVLINYPAGDGLKPGYDPRNRPWYLSTRGSRGPQWGGLYGDASGSGTLLPCNRAVYDAKDDLLAVVGIDFRLADVQASVPVPQLSGYRDAWLLDAQGRVVVEARDETLEGADVQDHRKRELRLFPEKRVLQALRQQRASGHLVVRGTHYFYSAVRALDWTYLVAADGT